MKNGRDALPDRQDGWGKIQVYTGKGKGKTTAALGTALRAQAQGKKVAFIYFDKGGVHYSEAAILDRLGIPYVRTGLDRIDPQTGKFRFGVKPEDKAEGQLGLDKAKELMAAGNLDLLVLDEVCISASLGIISTQDVLDLIALKSPQLELILTGRDAPKEITDLADLVTEMTLVKHYFYKGEPAREGLDY
ncbi:MAG: cob(I)yrinic acid a,c-diamide adenosyltransferase [Parcubacteria group bacterium]|nr:cob(I)yrinic acid a,c-diamide adenosyltransferase [Parcubacteria group bacterium]